jgi:hypothetical protein
MTCRGFALFPISVYDGAVQEPDPTGSAPVMPEGKCAALSLWGRIIQEDQL